MTYISVSPNSVALARVTIADRHSEISRERHRNARAKTRDSRIEARRTEPEPHDLQRFEEMFLTYRPRFLHMAEGILRNREDAEDAVQNAFISAFRHLRSFEGRSALRTWFTRVVLNAALMIRRRRRTSWLGQWPETKSADALDWTETLPGSQPDPEMIYAKKEVLRQIDAGLGTLKPILRQAFEMVYYRQMTINEASEFLGIPVSTLKARVFRARRQLASPSCQQLKSTSQQTCIAGNSEHAQSYHLSDESVQRLAGGQTAKQRSGVSKTAA